jgi:Holliday junction resolvase
MKKKRVDSRRKGARTECEAAEFLRGFGFTVERNARNGKSAADLDLSADPSLRHIHLEIKGDRSIGLATKALADAMDQAQRDSGGKPWGVLWKQHRGPWVLTVRVAWKETAHRVHYVGEDVAAGLRELCKGGESRF